MVWLRAGRDYIVLAVALCLFAGCDNAGPPAVEPPVMPSASPTPWMRVVAQAPAGPVELRICDRNENWQQPTREEQAYYIVSDRRYQQFGPLEEAAFAARFWRDTFSASGLGSMTRLSGLWTLSEGLFSFTSRVQPRDTNCQTGREALNAVNLWLLGYEALTVSSDGDKLVVSVQATTSGFQVIQLPLAGGAGCCPGVAVDFIDASGTLLESIDPQSIWSRPP